LAVLALFASLAAQGAAPNVILVLADDLGFGDIGANGQSLIKTPTLDRMAREGVRLTSFYASANVCTPSRAGLMTGRYAIRSGLAHQVIEPDDEHGLPQAEITIAELLRDVGYRTALIGKWHLGHTQEHWPSRHGFDSFFGLPYSNDMQPLALYHDERAIEEPVAQATLTERYTAEALRVIADDDERPFFVFLSHTFPHIPLHASKRFAGRSRGGLYGDVVEELDWSMGEIFRALREKEIERDTLVIFTSDNGAWFEGDNGAYREGKGTTWDGGYRVPLLAWWPGRIPAGAVSDGLAMNIDILPTLAALAGRDLPKGLMLDGRDIWPLLQGKEASPHEVLYFFNNEDIAAVRTPRWKLMVHSYYRRNLAAFDQFEQGIGFSYWLLFDMQAELPERFSVARENPDVLERMLGYLDAGREQFAGLRTRPPPTTVP
jgi:uncharacterized sulfatase